MTAKSPQTPWNRRLIIHLFAFEALLSFLLYPLSITGAILQSAMAYFTVSAAVVGLINSLTHIFVIRTRRPIVLGAVVGVNTLMMLMWAALVACQIVFTVLMDTIVEHEVCTHSRGFRYDFMVENDDRECNAKKLGYACVPFAVLLLINSITILSLSIRALQREKRGIIAAPNGDAPVRTINLILWRPRRQAYMPNNSTELQDGPKASHSLESA